MAEILLLDARAHGSQARGESEQEQHRQAAGTPPVLTESDVAPDVAAARDGEGEPSGTEVLVVDDDPLVCALIEDVLKLRGHRVTTRTDGLSAWAVLQERSFPLVVLDWLLPGMDGLELCRRMRGLPHGSDTVVLVITARDRQEHLDEVLEAGANDYLSKPFELASLAVRLSIAERRVREVEERKRMDAALAHLALHDPLTDLPNRALLRDRLEQAILSSRRDDRAFALLVMDQDRFKEVNDTLGHQAGDLLLQQVGQRLRESVRASDTVARLGGDEFALVLPGTDTAGAVQAAMKLLQALEQPFALDAQVVDVRASIGIALYPRHGQDAQMLLRCADVAMYVAKRSGIGYAIYSAEQDEHLSGQLTLVSDLRRAIEQDQLVLHYQPKMDLKAGCIRSVEALVRWQHPKRGLLLPDQFIPQAERTGLIHPLGLWVLNAALRQCRDWAQRGLTVVVAANLSARNLQDSALPNALAELLARWQVPATQLRLEITQVALMTESSRTLSVLERIRELGVAIALDDFGTGFSWLGYLKRLPVQQIKIDMGFTRDLAVDENDRTIVRAMIELGHSLGLDVAAEGVEDQATWDLLTGMGCDTAQGFLLSQPLPPGELEGLLRARGRG